MFWKRLIISVAIFASARAVFAEDDAAPSLGVVYSTTSESAISYSCSDKNENQIHCKMVRMYVWKGVKVNKGMDIFRNQSGSITKDEWKKIRSKMDKICSYSWGYLRYVAAEVSDDEFARSLDVPEARRKYFRESLIQTTEGRKKSNIRSAQAMAEFCEDSNAVTFKKAMEAQEGIICSVWSEQFEQSFARVNADGQPPVWAAISEPKGICSVATLDSFSQIDQEWNYNIQRTVLNTHGKMGAFGCDGFKDENEMYVWSKPDDSLLDCKYVEFSPTMRSN